MCWSVLLREREWQCVVLVCVAKGLEVTGYCAGLCC